VWIALVHYEKYFSHINHLSRCKKLILLLLVTLLAAHTTKTFVRNYDWLDEYSIFMSGLKVNDRNAKLFNNVGHALESQGRFKEALNFFNMAVQVQGDDIGAHINVGRTYNHLKMFKEAEDAYLKVNNDSKYLYNLSNSFDNFYFFFSRPSHYYQKQNRENLIKHV